MRSTEADVSLTKPSCGKMLYVLPYAVKMTKMQLNMCHPLRCIIPLYTQILLKTKRDKVFSCWGLLQELTVITETMSLV